jgi:hypothetical protein
MAVGDIKSDVVSVGTGGTLDIQPPSGEEWKIHNLFVDAAAASGSIDLIVYDGVDTLTAAALDPGLLSNLAIGVTNSIYLRLKNNDSAARALGYEGVQTK